MKLLLDHCVDRRLAASLRAHSVSTAAELGWEQLRNGALLADAAGAGFDAVLTTDANLKSQQDLATLPIAVVVLRARSNRLADLLPLVPRLEESLAALAPRTLIEIGQEP